jgi:hypothetical protein
VGVGAGALVLLGRLVLGVGFVVVLAVDGGCWCVDVLRGPEMNSG